MKKALVIWSDEALLNLETIFDFLECKSTTAAQHIIEKIIGKAKQLETFPESGSIQETIKKEKQYLYLVQGDYKI